MTGNEKWAKMHCLTEQRGGWCLYLLCTRDYESRGSTSCSKSPGRLIIAVSTAQSAWCLGLNDDSDIDNSLSKGCLVYT